MKAMLVKKSNKGNTSEGRPSGRGPAGGVITPSMVDNKIQYVGRRIRKSAVVAKISGSSLPNVQKMRPAVLLVKGDKPGYLAHRVKWDEKDTYVREFANGQMKFGTLSANNTTGNKAFHAEMINMGELLRRVAKNNKAVKVTRHNDDTEHTLFLLNSIGDPYVVAIEMDEKQKPRIRNIEPLAPYNRKCPFRFIDPKDVKIDVRRVLAAAKQ